MKSKIPNIETVLKQLGEHCWKNDDVDMYIERAFTKTVYDHPVFVRLNWVNILIKEMSSYFCAQ